MSSSESPPHRRRGQSRVRSAVGDHASETPEARYAKKLALKKGPATPWCSDVSSSPSGSDSDGSESEDESPDDLHEGARVESRESAVGDHANISDGLCGFRHLHMVPSRSLFCMAVQHHEVTFVNLKHLKLLLEALAGHEVAAKKDLRLLLSAHQDNIALLQNVPPRPKKCGDDKAKPAFGGKVELLSKAQRQEQDHQRKIDDVLALCLKHEGEQRLWAYSMHWTKVAGEFPEEAEAAIVRDYKQLREPVIGGKRKHCLCQLPALGDEVAGFDGKTTLLARAIGSNGTPVKQKVYYKGKALTLSLAEVLRDYHLITTAKELYERWKSHPAVVGHRKRSQNLGGRGSISAELNVKGKGGKGSSSSSFDHHKGGTPGKGKQSRGSSSGSQRKKRKARG